MLTFANHWRNAKNIEGNFKKESAIVAISDFLEAGIKMWREVKMLGNVSMIPTLNEFTDDNLLKIINGLVDTLDLFTWQEVREIKDLISTYSIDIASEPHKIIK